MNWLAASICILISFALFWYVRRLRNSLGLPAGKVIYIDTDKWGPVEQPLYDPSLGLVGKPDYLMEQGDQIIPIELKSTRSVTTPYDAHIFQLAAYCLLVHRHFGKRPRYGILKYPNRSFSIEYSPKLEETVLQLIEEMHQQDRRKELHRSHEQPVRCKSCSYHNTCDQRLL